MHTNASHERAKSSLIHYLRTAWEASGLQWGPDNDAEAGGIIDDIVDWVETDATEDLDHRVEELERSIEKIKDI